jgi:hypothetical protein
MFWRVVLAVAGGLLAAAAPAHAKTFTGTTAQGRPVTVTTSAIGVPKHVQIGWSAACNHGRAMSPTTTFNPLNGGATKDGVAVDITVHSVLPNGDRAPFTAHVRGVNTDHGWRGTLNVTGRVTRHGRVLRRCKLRGLKWSAGGAQAPHSGARFVGETAAHRVATLFTGADGRVARARVWWSAACRDKRFAFTTTHFARPFKLNTRDHAKAGGTYSEPAGAGRTFRVTVAFEARRTGGRWHGTITGSIKIMRGQQVKTRCTMKRKRWSAGPV